MYGTRRRVLGGFLAATATAALAKGMGGTFVRWSSPEAAGFTQAGIDRLHALGRGQVDQGILAGYVTLLVRHGKVVDLDVYGHRRIADGTPMRRDTIFRLASQSKPITGAAMMVLFDEGKWRLEDPITKYVPQFAHLKVLKGLDAAGKPILEDAKRPATMRELMSNTAGFAYGFGQDYLNQRFWNDRVLFSRDLQELIDRIATEPLAYQPGEKWQYGISIDIQGYIIEKISGHPFPEFLRKRLFEPLGMKDTGFAVPKAEAGRLAGLYSWNQAAGLQELVVGGNSLNLTAGGQPVIFPTDYTEPPPYYPAGGGGMVSTADDYGRLCQMLLNKGQLDGVRVLSRKAVDLMTHGQLPTAYRQWVGKSFGNVFTGPGASWGFDIAVVEEPALAGWPSKAGKGSLTWGGLTGPFFWIDPKNDFFFILLDNRTAAMPPDKDLWSLTNRAVYAAMA